MSFYNNPYHCMHVCMEGGRFTWMCESCGEESSTAKPPADLIGVDTLESLASNWRTHVRRSHNLTADDVLYWDGVNDG